MTDAWKQSLAAWVREEMPWPFGDISRHDAEGIDTAWEIATRLLPVVEREFTAIAETARTVTRRSYPEGASPGAPQWQPIATAPTDGRLLLLYPSRGWAADVPGDAEVGYWSADTARWEDATMSVGADDYAGPTHWMALPDAPSGASPGASPVEDKL